MTRLSNRLAGRDGGPWSDPERDGFHRRSGGDELGEALGLEGVLRMSSSVSQYRRGVTVSLQLV